MPKFKNPVRIINLAASSESLYEIIKQKKDYPFGWLSIN